jgi:hypothetical protein
VKGFLHQHPAGGPCQGRAITSSRFSSSDGQLGVEDGEDGCGGGEDGEWD